MAFDHTKMFSLVRKDKRLSSARKRLMSQLGKRKRRARNSFREQATIQDQEPSDEVAGTEDETSQSTDMEPEISELLLESDSVHPASSESEYFPTPEK